MGKNQKRFTPLSGRWMTSISGPKARTCLPLHRPCWRGLQTKVAPCALVARQNITAMAQSSCRQLRSLVVNCSDANLQMFEHFRFCNCSELQIFQSVGAKLVEAESNGLHEERGFAGLTCRHHSLPFPKTSRSRGEQKISW